MSRLTLPVFASFLSAFSAAAQNGLYADFSPKPILDKAGSGFHINISCSDSSKTKNALAGILSRAQEISFYLNSTENSYQRLGEHKAPNIIAWGNENRSAFIRVPSTKEEPRFEIRSADSECNVYLAFTLLIHAALDGIKNNLEPPAEAAENLFAQKKSALKTLPKSLAEAKKLASQSDFVKKALGF
ncbi:MAG: hypothetical protein II814_01095 [Treponema sp.]|nr:hypothetical protein [Treponema sp.]